MPQNWEYKVVKVGPPPIVEESAPDGWEPVSISMLNYSHGQIAYILLRRPR